MLFPLALFALADEPQRLDVHNPKRPVALGSRAGVWAGPYSSPAVGGHIKLKASKHVGLEGFADHTLRIEDQIARHDHVIGFSAYTPALLGDHRWFASPTIGACADFRVDTPLAARAPSSTDILFGTHAGAMVELAVGRGWSLETTGTAFVYWGNEAQIDDWSATASNKLHTSAVGQFIASVNYTL